MTTNQQTGSATIYQFPARGRFAARQETASAQQSVQTVRAATGGAWYHDEAIEADRLRKTC